MNLTGQIFGKLTVISKCEQLLSSQIKDQRSRWLCRCDCGKTKAIYEFCLKRGSCDCGCAAISKAAETKKRWYLQNHEINKELRRQYHAQHRSIQNDKRRECYLKNIEREKKSRHEWRIRNRDKANEDKRKWLLARPGYQQEWRKNNLEKARELTRLWQRRNPDKKQESVTRRRVRQIGNGCEKYSRAAVIKRDNSRCHICGKLVKKTELTLDHLIPISQGGPDTFNNVSVAHKSCNSKRGPGRIPAQLLLSVYR